MEQFPESYRILWPQYSSSTDGYDRSSLNKLKELRPSMMTLLENLFQATFGSMADIHTVISNSMIYVRPEDLFNRGPLSKLLPQLEPVFLLKKSQVARAIAKVMLLRGVPMFADYVNE
jgi:hypothetical protein